MQNICQYLAEKINKEDEIWDITKKGIQGSINWEEGLTKRVELIDEELIIETCKEVADSLPIMTGATTSFVKLSKMQDGKLWLYLEGLL